MESWPKSPESIGRPRPFSRGFFKKGLETTGNDRKRPEMIENDHIIPLKVEPGHHKSPESIGRFYGEITKSASNGLETRGNDRK